MKKTPLLLLAFHIIGFAALAQNGLKQIQVEKYYVSNAADSVASVGMLPAGSVTYRIYAQMLPGYNFQMAYGNMPHPLSISTSTAFFNNEDRGATTPTYTKAQAANNTVMLDSWLSVGAACTGNFGVMKTDDNAIATVANADGILKNADATAGIPLTSRDGLLAGAPKTVTFVGLTTGTTANDLSVFDATSNAGNLFTTNNGAWACLGGATGPNVDSNRVLIAQMTTNGMFSFQLNVQVGTPSGGTEIYVYSNPTGSEITIGSLTYPAPISTSIPEGKAHYISSLNAYPNPAHDRLHLEFSDGASNLNRYVVYDLIGHVVLQKELGPLPDKYTENIDLSGLANGLYIVTLSSDNLLKTQKIIKN
jgi:hypothetical protein